MNKRSCGLPGIQWRVPFVSIAALVSVFVLAENATAQTPRDAEDYNNRGLTRQNSGDIDRAIEDYSKAISLNGRPITIATAYNNNRANARLSKNDLEGAVADYIIDDGLNEAKASPLDSGTVKPQFVETFPVILAVNLDLITHFVKTAAKAGANSFLQYWANYFAAPAIC